MDYIENIDSIDFINDINSDNDIIFEINNKDDINDFIYGNTVDIHNKQNKNYYETIGYSSKQLMYIGFKKDNFINSGYSVFDLKNDGFKKADFIYTGYTVFDLKNDGFIKTDFTYTGYTVLDLKNGSFVKTDFTYTGYTISDLKNGGFVKRDFESTGYTISELKNAGFTKSEYDKTGYSLYYLLETVYYNHPISELIDIGFSNQIIDQYKTFIFDISWSVWSSKSPKKYPINNNLDSFKDISINQLTDLKTRITTITIQWSKFIDMSTNDGLSFNEYTFPFYNEPSVNIRQFGGIPLSRNSVNNSNFWQFYKFGGKISANDIPTILPDTSLYNCFRDSSCNSFNGIGNWTIGEAIDIRNMFYNAIYFDKQLKNWIYTDNVIENMITNTGYNPLQTSIFLQDLSSNTTLYDISLGKIPKYLDSSNTRIAIQSIRGRNVTFEISGNLVVSDIQTFKSSGYSTNDLRTAGFSILDLSGSRYSIIELKSGGYTLSEIKTLNKFGAKYYIDSGFTLQELVDSSYTAIDLSINGFRPIDYYNLVPRYDYIDLKIVFNINEIISGGYDLFILKEIGYSVSQIKEYSNYTILDYKNIGYSMTDISNAGFLFSSLLNFTPLPQILKDNSLNVIDFKNINYEIHEILKLKYSLHDLYDVSYTIQEIEMDISNNPFDISYGILDYKKTGYSITDISNAGFSIHSLKDFTPLPQILKDNSFNVADFKNANYDISFIHYDLKYSLVDLRDASYTINEMKIFGFTVTDLSNAGFTATDLKNNGYSVSDLSGIYNVSNMIDASYSIVDLSRNATPTDYAKYLNTHQTKTNIIVFFIDLLNFSYTITDLKLIPVDNSYNYFLFSKIYTIYQEPSLKSYFDFSFNITTAFNDLLLDWNSPSIVQNSGIISAYVYYFDLGIHLEYIQKIDFTRYEIILLQYVGEKEQNQVSISDFSNNHFTVDKLLKKTMYIQGTIYNEINDLFINTDHTFYYKYKSSPFLWDGERSITSNNEYSYNYNEITTKKINDVDYLELYDGGTIDLTNRYSFYDNSNNILRTYNKIKISTKGWLSLIDDTNLLCTIRYLPYDTTDSTIKYSFYFNNNSRLEINVTGRLLFNDSSEQEYTLIIHIFFNGVITIHMDANFSLINGLYFSSPDPLMDTSRLFYSLPLRYFQSAMSNPFPYSTLRFDFRVDKNGFSVRELINAGYSIQNIFEASGNILDLRNLGYSANNMKNLGYSMYEIITAYNTNILGLLSLGYTFIDFKQYHFSKQQYENSNITVRQLYDASYSIYELKNSGYSLIDISNETYSIYEYISFNFPVISREDISNNPFLLDTVFSNSKVIDYFEELKILYNTVGYLDDYKNQEITELFNIIPIENLYTGNMSGLTLDFYYKLDQGFYKIYPLYEKGIITLKEIHDASFSLYDLNTNINEINSYTFSYNSLVVAGYPIDEINDYYYYSILNESDSFIMTGFSKPTPSITYYYLNDYTSYEKIRILYSIYDYSELLDSGFGIDFILENEYSIKYYEYLIDSGIPEISIQKLLFYKYSSYNIFLLYYTMYEYTIEDIYGKIQDEVNVKGDIYYLFSLYKTLLIDNYFNFIYYKKNQGEDIYINYQIDVPKILDFGSDVSNIIPYDIEIQLYYDSSFSYSSLDLYNNGFSIDLITPYYTLSEFQNDEFSIRLLNQYFKYSLETYKNAGYQIDDFKSAGYSVLELSGNYTLSEMRNCCYTVEDILKSFPNTSISELKTAGFLLHDFAKYFTIDQFILAGYSRKDLNEVGNILELYCKKKCINEKTTSSTMSKQSSKMSYSQTIRGRTTTFTSNYVNSNIPASFLCIDNNQQTYSVSRSCNSSSKTSMNKSYFIRDYITKQAKYYNAIGEINQYITDITDIQNKYFDTSLVQIVNNYFYIINLGIQYPDPVVEYMIVNNSLDKIKVKFPSTNDSEMKTYILLIQQQYSVEEPKNILISQIVTMFISELGTI